MDHAVAINKSGQVVAIHDGVASYLLNPSPDPLPPPPPSAPDWLSAGGMNGRVQLDWAVGSAGLTYKLMRSTTSGGPYATIATGLLSISYMDVAVTNGTRYYYVVIAVNDTGQESGNSREATALPLATPAAPTGLTASAIGKKKVSLKWTQSTSAGVTSNRIYRSTTISATPMQIAEISPGTSYTDTSVNGGVTYYYRVASVNLNGQESVYSNQAFAKPR